MWKSIRFALSTICTLVHGGSIWAYSWIHKNKTLCFEANNFQHLFQEPLELIEKYFYQYSHLIFKSFQLKQEFFFNCFTTSTDLFYYFFYWKNCLYLVKSPPKKFLVQYLTVMEISELPNTSFEHPSLGVVLLAKTWIFQWKVT